MLLPTYINVNRGGIPAISSLSVTVTANEVQFDFNNHRNIGAPFRGLLIVRLNQAIPAGTTTTLPIVFTSGGGNAQKLMHCLSELESKSGEHYMERYGKRRRGGMRDSDYDDYPRYY